MASYFRNNEYGIHYITYTCIIGINLTLPTTLCALPFFIGLCNVSIVKISPQRHLKRGLWAGAKFLVDHRRKERQQDGGPLTPKVQAITEYQSITFVSFHEGVAPCKLSPKCLKNIPHLSAAAV